MKTLSLTPEKLEWLFGAVEGRPAQNTGNAKIKGQLMIELAELMEAEKPVLKEAKS